MKILFKIILTICWLYVLAGTVITGEVWRTIGFFLLGVITAINMGLLWNKKLNIELE